MKRIKRTLSTLIAGTMVFSFVGCGVQTALLEESEYFVEFGEVFNEKPTEDCEMSVTDANGTEVKTSYGSFKPTVGEYTIVYTSTESNKKQTVKVFCQDTIAPSVQFKPYNGDVAIGDTVSVPYFEVRDYSKIISQSVKVLSPDGTEVSLNETNSWQMQEGVYTVIVTATDAYENTANVETKFIARASWIDEDLAENVLYSFNDENYINLVYGRTEYESFTPSIEKSGYPAIETQIDNNGVLALKSDYNYGDVYATFASHNPIKAKTAQKITFRVAVDRAVDYVKICNNNDDIAGRIYNLSPNTWYDLEVDPIDFGWGNEMTEFYLYARADQGLTVWVDEVTYTSRWVDTALPIGYLADFDETEYTQNMYQNTYGGVAFATGNGSSLFSVVEYPHDTSKRVLKVETTGSKGGFTYMFDEAVRVEDIESITISIDCVYACKNLWLGFMKSDYRSGGATGVQHWYDTAIYPNSIPWNGRFDSRGEVNELVELVIPADALAKEDSYITGIYLGVIDSVRTSNVIYIDYISVQYK